MRKNIFSASPRHGRFTKLTAKTSTDLIHSSNEERSLIRPKYREPHSVLLNGNTRSYVSGKAKGILPLQDKVAIEFLTCNNIQEYETCHSPSTHDNLRHVAPRAARQSRTRLSIVWTCHCKVEPLLAGTSTRVAVKSVTRTLGLQCWIWNSVFFFNHLGLCLG
ncbi:unnamed protein product, partial [Brenthis ino]